MNWFLNDAYVATHVEQSRFEAERRVRLAHLNEPRRASPLSALLKRLVSRRRPRRLLVEGSL